VRRIQRHARRHERARPEPGERRLADEHLVRRDAEGVDVGAMIDLGIGRGLLGCHVQRRAERRAGVGEGRASSVSTALGAAQRLGDAEIGNRGGAAGEQNVVRLDVAVHDAALVRIGECARDVLHDRHRLRHGEATVREQSCAERLAVDVWHDEIRQPVGDAGAQHAHDVGMLQTGRQQDLAAEPIDRDGGGHVLRKHLDGYAALQRVVERDEDARHAATLELTLDGVGGAEGGAELVDEGGLHVVRAGRSSSDSRTPRNDA